jgi:NitT/TauT family transport system substrate-binding protein
MNKMKEPNKSKASRRRFLKKIGLAGTGLVSSALMPFSTRADIKPELAMYGPPVGPSLMLAHVTETDGLSDIVSNLSFETYRNPDILRTGFVSGRWSLAGTPSYVAANLSNKGIPVSLMNIMTWGLLYVISTDEKVKTIEDLKGQDIAMPFKADMPDLVFQHIATTKGMKAGSDYRFNYVANPFQGLQLLLSGRVKHAVLPEPAATASIIKGLKSSMKVYRAISLQHAWGEATQGPASIPQAGMMVTDTLLQEMPELPQVLNQAITQSTEWVVNNPSSAGRMGEAYLGLKAPIIERSIPHSNFKLTTAREGKAEIEKFFSVLAEANPAIIGGSLPSDSFYLA